MKVWKMLHKSKKRSFKVSHLRAKTFIHSTVSYVLHHACSVWVADGCAFGTIHKKRRHFFQIFDSFLSHATIFLLTNSSSICHKLLALVFSMLCLLWIPIFWLLSVESNAFFKSDISSLRCSDEWTQPVCYVVFVYYFL